MREGLPKLAASLAPMGAKLRLLAPIWRVQPVSPLFFADSGCGGGQGRSSAIVRRQGRSRRRPRDARRRE